MICPIMEHQGFAASLEQLELDERIYELAGVPGPPRRDRDVFGIHPVESAVALIERRVRK